MEPMLAPQFFAERRMVDVSAALQWSTTEPELKPFFTAMLSQASFIVPSGVVMKTISAFRVTSHAVSVKLPDALFQEVTNNPDHRGNPLP
jgi:hypothetical protein